MITLGEIGLFCIMFYAAHIMYKVFFEILPSEYKKMIFARRNAIDHHRKVVEELRDIHTQIKHLGKRVDALKKND
jgi:hypothetical protein